MGLAGHAVPESPEPRSAAASCLAVRERGDDRLDRRQVRDRARAHAAVNRPADGGAGQQSPGHRPGLRRPILLAIVLHRLGGGAGRGGSRRSNRSRERRSEQLLPRQRDVQPGRGPPATRRGAQKPAPPSRMRCGSERCTARRCPLASAIRSPASASSPSTKATRAAAIPPLERALTVPPRPAPRSDLFIADTKFALARALWSDRHRRRPPPRPHPRHRRPRRLRDPPPHRTPARDRGVAREHASDLMTVESTISFLHPDGQGLPMFTPSSQSS